MSDSARLLFEQALRGLASGAAESLAFGTSKSLAFDASEFAAERFERAVERLIA